MLSVLEGWSQRLFGSFSKKIFGNIIEFKNNLQKAGMKIYPETYISLMFFSAILTLPISCIAIVLLYFTKFIPLIILVPTPVFVMIGFIVVPMMKAGERGRTLEREMPFTGAYITVMATGGISPYVSFKRLATVELMPAVSREAREVLRDVEIFGMDPLTALNKAAKNHPLDIFRDFVSGYASTVITGGDVTHFLETKTEEVFKTRAARIKAAAERLGMLLETFVIIMVLMSLCFYILFSVESIYSIGVSLYSGVILYTYVFTPILSVVFIYLAHDMQPKTPITDWRPYKAYAISSSVAVLVLFLLTGFFGFIQAPFLKSIVDLPTAVAISLVISAAPPAIIASRTSRRRTSIEKGLSGFLRDLTEVRKTGLAPEKCIESLSKREYGEFGKELEKITSQLSWGVPLRQVFMEFVRRTKSWLSQVVIFLLVEAIDVGGGTIAMIESLARFNQMTQEVEREKRMSVRPYMFIPYFAAILLTATTLMVLIFLTKTVSIAGSFGPSVIKIDLEYISMIFTTSVIIHSYTIGMVAGKISEESISAGFKHSALLVVITLLAARIIPTMVTF